jgi:DNA repair exonuclease SbcCD nuclease subunit
LLGQQQIDYWALGGRHQPAWFEAAPRTAHYPGTPQGRCPNETGAHGCTMVSVGLDRRVHIQSVPTDSVRWQTEPVTLEDGASGEDLRRRLSDRAEEIAAEGAGCCVLVSWIVSGGARMGAQLQHRGLADEIILELRQEFGRRSPAVWTVSLVGQPPESWPSQQRDEDTILGDFLRAVRQCETNDDELPDLTPYLPQHDPAGLLASAAQIRDARARASVLRQAAMLGADLLRGDDEGVPR